MNKRSDDQLCPAVAVLCLFNVYIVYMKYVVCLHCVCEICCMFMLVCENILQVYNFGQHGVSIRDDDTQ